MVELELVELPGWPGSTTSSVGWARFSELKELRVGEQTPLRLSLVALRG